MSKEIEIVKYQSLLGKIKTAIQQARLRATLTANAEMILLYWQTGKLIAKRQQQEGWSAKVIPRLAADLQHEFATLKVFREETWAGCWLFTKNIKQIQFCHSLWQNCKRHKICSKALQICHIL